MLNKNNYVPWSSRLLHYAKSKPNGKFLYNSIMHEPTDEKLTTRDIKADRKLDDQLFNYSLWDHPEDINSVVDIATLAKGNFGLRRT
ncbi:hypothetical protein Tco_0680953 [Tanacetum coccineum]|uniref:Uncharacterized protein n=1 Tax=Tanacetum coccineum TaxID=301880 RepID=A0ABQ4XM85_9ASTR